MSPLVAIAALAGIGGWFLFGKKPAPATSTTGVTVPLPTITTNAGAYPGGTPGAGWSLSSNTVNGTRSISDPGGTVYKVPASSVTYNAGHLLVSLADGRTVFDPEILLDLPSPAKVRPPTETTPGSVVVTVPPVVAPVVVAASNTSPVLAYDEQVSIESDLPNDLYNKAMASQHKIYVAAAAAKLASLADTRAMDLTLRVANWGS